jgi:hypothetical protein
VQSAMLMPTEPELLLDAANWVDKWPEVCELIGQQCASWCLRVCVRGGIENLEDMDTGARGSGIRRNRAAKPPGLVHQELAQIH